MRPWTAWVAVALLVISARTGRGDVRYSVTDLGALTGAQFSWALSINNAGVVVGTGILDSGAYQAYAWSQGSARAITFSPGDYGSGALHVNASGQIVGWRRPDVRTPPPNGAVLNPDGTWTDFGQGSYAASINDSGQVVGFRYDPAAGGDVAFSWTGGTLTDLPGLGGLNTLATDVNNAGQIVGYGFVPGSYISHACLWQNGVVQDLGSLAPDGQSVAAAINDRGDTIGWSEIPGGTSARAVLWKNGGIIDLGDLAGRGSQASDINNLGQIVGGSTPVGGTQPHAALWQDGIPVDLNSLIPATSGWTLLDASAINDMGQIVGWGDVDGQGHAFLLTPVPEPTALCVITIGAFGIACVRRRS